MDIYQWVGFAGTILIAWAYFLLQIEKYTTNSMSYQILNLVGAILLIISLFVHFNFGSFAMEIFWIAITLYGIYKIIKNKSKK